MASYRYQNGDRPLDGFTIEHAVGRGGFGEVYYAVSDSGRQVALKAVQNYEDIELRGISHCMNLKSPHLVSIFDVKYTDGGDPFVIMEYVSGPSLRQLLDEAPEGLGPEKAAWFVREIAKGLALLHDNGIVHRDLKPHNVFVEDGYVKVGDYSLSKAISTSHRSGHTVTVGSVHYMAPEISLGRYGRSVEFYALGVLLFEMLTGNPPFLGQTMPEVLMKHMSHDVDTSGLAEPFASVVSKAMAREPEQRYQTVEVMVEALFGSDAVRDGVSTFSPQSLTVMARQAAIPPTPRPPQPARAERVRSSQPEYGRRPRGTASQRSSVAYHFGRFWGRATAAFATRVWSYEDQLTNRLDTIGFRYRVFLGLCTVVLSAVCAGTITANAVVHRPEENVIFGLGLTILVLVSSSLVVAHYLTLRLTRIPWFLHRVLYAAPPLIPVMLVTEMHGVFGRGDESMTMGLAVAIPMLLQDWRWLTAPVRPQRIMLPPCLLAAFVAMVVAAIGDGDLAIPAFGIMGGVVLSVQVMSRFDLTASKRLSGSTEWLSSLTDSVEAWYTWRIGPGATGYDDRMPSESSGRGESKTLEGTGLSERDVVTRSTPVDSTTDSATNSPQAAIEESGVGLSNTADREGECKSRVAALILSLVPFGSFGLLPIFGLHRFYAGRFFTGVLWVVTFGLLGIGQLIDIVVIAVGEFRDRSGRPLTMGSGDEAEQVNGLSAVPSGQSLVNGTLAVLGALLLALDILLGFVLALNLPKMIASDVFRDMDLTASEVQRLMGAPNWDDTVWDVSTLFVAVVGLAAIGLLTIARRNAGAQHTGRVVLSGFGFVGAFVLLSEGAYYIRWPEVAAAIQAEKVIPAIDAVIGRDFISSCIGTLVLLMAALFVLAWPPRRNATTVTQPHREPLEQRV